METKVTRCVHSLTDRKSTRLAQLLSPGCELSRRSWLSSGIINSLPCYCFRQQSCGGDGAHAAPSPRTPSCLRLIVIENSIFFPSSLRGLVLLLLEEMDGSPMMMINRNQVLSGAWAAPPRLQGRLSAGLSWAVPVQSRHERSEAGGEAGFPSPPSDRLASDSERLPLGDVKRYLNGCFSCLLSHCVTFIFFYFFECVWVLTAAASMATAPLLPGLL